MKGDTPILRTSQRALLPSLLQRLREELHAHFALVRFAIVGGSGYLLYQANLFLIYDSPVYWFLPSQETSGSLILFEHGDIRLLVATAVASVCTLFWVFTGHNLWTFRGRNPGKPLWRRFLQYVATVSIGATIVAVTVNVLAVRFDIYHFIALPIGVAVAGVWDWFLYSRFVWRRAPH